MVIVELITRLSLGCVWMEDLEGEGRRRFTFLF